MSDERTAAAIAGQRHAALTAAALLAVSALSVFFVWWVVGSSDLNETEPYADVRKLLAVLFGAACLPAVTLALIHSIRASQALRAASVPEGPRLKGLNPIIALLRMAPPIIVTCYVILIYAVDGGIF